MMMIIIFNRDYYNISRFITIIIIIIVLLITITINVIIITTIIVTHY